MDRRQQLCLTLVDHNALRHDLSHLGEVGEGGGGQLCPYSSSRSLALTHSLPACCWCVLWYWWSQCVVGIVDHHEDKGQYPSVSGEQRLIAFEQAQQEGQLGQPGVASACTLVAHKVAQAGPRRQGLQAEPDLVAVSHPSIVCWWGGQYLSGAGSGASSSLLDASVATLLLGVIMIDSAGLDPKVSQPASRPCWIRC